MPGWVCQPVVPPGENLISCWMTYLSQAYRERSGWMTYLNIGPRLDSLRSDARFIELLHRVRLVH